MNQGNFFFSLAVVMAFALIVTMMWLIVRMRKERRENKTLNDQLRYAVKAQAIVIALENSSAINPRANRISVQLLLRCRLDDSTIEEGFAIWNIKPAFIPQVQPGCMLPVLLDKNAHRFYPDVSWAQHDAALAHIWDRQVAGRY